MNILQPIRRASQAFGLIIANLYISVFYRSEIYKGPMKSVCVPFLYCHACPTANFACPIGTLQHYSAIRKFPFFLIGHLMIVGLLVGRMACGWLCPFGLFQEVMYKIKSKKIEIPKVFSYMPYAVLIILAILLPYFTTEHWFSKLCPVGTMVAGIPWVAWNPINPTTGDPTILPGTVGVLYWSKILLLVGFLYLFVVAKRPFCRYVCPLGLFWSFFNKISIMKLEVSDGCTKCGICKNKCPEDIKVYEEPNSRDCIRCLDCTSCEHINVVFSLPVKEIKVVKKKAGMRNA
ncbi:MAG: 4Fe-4S binding protein [Candidatus Omnitrophica bacterium]|nr:4Fe-4S binding protein [Candidatus Omnitrophota bacterium]